MAAEVFAFIHLASGHGGRGLSPQVAAAFALPLGPGATEATADGATDAEGETEADTAATAMADGGADGAGANVAAVGAGAGSSLEQAASAATAAAMRSMRVIVHTIVERGSPVLWLVAACVPWSS
jgi:hypothetical protein